MVPGGARNDAVPRLPLRWRSVGLCRRGCSCCTRGAADPKQHGRPTTVPPASSLCLAKCSPAITSEVAPPVRSFPPSDPNPLPLGLAHSSRARGAESTESSGLCLRCCAAMEAKKAVKDLR